MARMFGIELVFAAVRERATFLEAASSLTEHPVSAIAVLADDDSVVGIFGNDRLIHGLFPVYLVELHHTAFATDDPAVLLRCASEAAAEPVNAHMSTPTNLDIDDSAMHVAEVILHEEHDALPVCKNGKFVGMLGRSEFGNAMLLRSQEASG